MYEYRVCVSLKVIELVEGGTCVCELCDAELATGNRGLAAFHGGTWYAVYQALCCDCCDDNTWVPVLCSPQTAAAVAKRTAELMELDFKEFYLAPMEFQPLGATQ